METTEARKIVDAIVAQSPMLIEPGKTYVIELNKILDNEQMHRLGEHWQQATNSRAIFLHPDMKMVRKTPHVCPVCNAIDGGMNCKSCERGVVWG